MRHGTCFRLFNKLHKRYYANKMSKKLHFRSAAMNAGKSTALLQVAHNYEERSLKVIVMTAAIDDRYGVGTITSRLGVSRPAACFDATTDFERLDLSGAACLLIDEAQFCTPTQAQQLHRIAALRDVPVICYGLRTDFRGQPFPGSAMLLALADDIEEIKTICHCGSKATMNARLDSSGARETEGAQVEIGGNGRYRSMCAKCFYSSETSTAKNPEQRAALA